MHMHRLIEILELFAESILPIIFWMCLIFGFDAPYIAVLTILCAIIHEFAHYMTIKFFTKKISSVRGHTSGFRIKRQEALSYGKEICILLSGATINIALFLLTLPFGDTLHGYIRIFGYINLATGLSNLLPIEGYDGYEALCELCRYLGKDKAISFLKKLSFIISVAITFFSLYLIDRFSEGYWVFGLFFFSVLSKIAKIGKYDIFEQ